MFRTSKEEFEKEHQSLQNDNITILTSFEQISNTRQKIEIICSLCGNQTFTTLSHLRAGTRCQKCAIDRLRISETDFCLLKDTVLNNKQILVRTEYKNYKGAGKVLDCLCLVCGKEFGPTFYTLKVGCGCPKCARKKKAENQRITETEFLFLKEKLKNEQIELFTEYEDYKGSKSNLSCKCGTCEKQFISTYSKLRAGKGCPSCGLKRATFKRRISETKFDQIKSMLLSEQIVVMTEYKDYESSSVPLTCFCLICKKEFFPLYGNLQQGHRCPGCADRKLRISESEYERKVQAVEEQQKIRILTPYSEYTSVARKSDSLCLVCNLKIQPFFYSLFSGIGCGECWKRNGTSKQEDEVFQFITSEFPELLIERHNRSVLSGYEIDILLPQKKVGVEYHGLYWHSVEHQQKDKHQEKYNRSSAAGVKLIQVFSDEWENKRKIVESLIIHALGGTKNKISARKCNLVRMTKENEERFKHFFNETHISGWTRCFSAFGLEFDGNIVEAISFRRPFVKKYGKVLEIARSCIKLGTCISGGFSRLLKFARQNLPQLPILSYSDLRFGDGDVYLKNGFELIGRTAPDYFYTDGKKKYNRFHFRAIEGRTEKQVAEASGVFPVYGAGHKIYLLHVNIDPQKDESSEEEF